MAESSAKFNLIIGAVDQFTGPFKVFGSAMDAGAGKLKKLGAEFSKFKKGLDKALGFSQTKAALTGLGQGLARVGGEARKLFGTFARVGAIAGLTGGGLVGGVYKLSQGFADAGAQADEMAQKLGLTAQQWQSMTYAAKMNGVEAALLQGSYEKLNQNLIAAAQGGKTQAAAFQALGVSLKSVKEPGKLKATDQLMTDLAEAFSKLPNDARKATLATQVFGQAGTRLLPMLNKGAAGLDELRQRAVEYGLVFEGEAVAAGAAFNESLDDTRLKVTGLGFSIGRSFLPVTHGLVKMFGELVDENRDLIKTKTAEWAKKITEVLPKIKQGFRDLIAAVPEVLKRVNAFAKALGGWHNIAKLAAAVLAGPLVRAIGGLVLPIKALGRAIMTTPIGLILGLATAFGALMAQAGVLEPFLDGISSGFGAMSGYISEAFVALVNQLAEVFGLAGENLRDANGQLNPEGWKELGVVIGGFAGSALADLVRGLAEAVRLFKELGQWLGSTAGKLITGIDVQAMEGIVAERGKILQSMKAEADAGTLTPARMAEYQGGLDTLKNDEWNAQHYKMASSRSAGLEFLKSGSLNPAQWGAGLGRKYGSGAAFLPGAGGGVKTAPPLLGEGALQTIREISEHTEIKETKVEVAVKVTAAAGATATGSLNTSGNSENVTAGLSFNAGKVGVSNSGG